MRVEHISYTGTCLKKEDIGSRAKEFLSELQSMSPKVRAQYFLGRGSAREVYLFEEKYVIKISRFTVHQGNPPDRYETLDYIQNSGRGQTEKEIKIHNECDDKYRYLLNPIIAHGEFEGVPFVVMPKLKIAENITDYRVENLDEFIVWYDLAITWKFNQDLEEFAEKYGLDYSDLCENTGNFGVNGSNRLLIADYGFPSEGFSMRKVAI